MQETSYKDLTGNEKKLQEFYTTTEKNEEKAKQRIEASMEKRLTELKTKGHSLKRRVKIGRNQVCPCGSGKKFKKCCIFRSYEV